MDSAPKARLIVALDFDSLAPALRLARQLAGQVGMFKIGKQLFTAEGPRAVERIAALGTGIFLDLKFHDIPNTVAGAVAAAAALPGVRLVNVHCLGGSAMIRAAAEALRRPYRRKVKLLGVTLLTSMDAAALREVGVAGSLVARVVKLARMGQRAGLDGVVASPLEIRAIRQACGHRFLIVTPGVRPADVYLGRTAGFQPVLFHRTGKMPALPIVGKDDQARTATPAAALRAAADYLVIGRPITSAPDPRAATASILAEMSAALPR